MTHLIAAILITTALLILFGLLCYAKGRYDQRLEAESLVKPWKKVNGNTKAKFEEQSQWYKPRVLENKTAA